MMSSLCFLQLNEKVYEFEQNKRNNLIFYGLNNEARETPEILIAKIQNIIRVTLGIRRDINLTKVSQEILTNVKDKRKVVPPRALSSPAPCKVIPPREF